MIRSSVYMIAAATTLCAAISAGCGLTPEIPEPSQLAAAKAAGKSYEAFAKARDAGDAAWARRAEGAAQVKAAIQSWETAYAVDPYDRHVLQHLALSYYYLANYFTPDEAEREKTHLKGNGYGVAAVRLNPEIRRAMDIEAKTLEEAIAAHATPGDVPGLYWMTVNLARAAEKKSIATRASTAPKLKQVMETIYKLGPSYYWGGVHRFFGAYYVKAPAQKDPLAQSKREFDRAVEVGKENLENTCLYAEYYAVTAQDRDLYEKLLNRVLASKPENDHPALRLDNTEARKRAKRLLEEADEKF